MKKLHLSLLFSLALVTASSQKVYFIYVQTESGQSFFVKMNEKIYSSSASGYIILSKLVDSTYNFIIGFPQNKWPEQNFSVTVSKKDHGYLLKNFGENGWGLFDLQSLIVQMGITDKASISEKPKVEDKDVSVFTDILSKAANDPSLKEKSMAAKKVDEKTTEVAVQEVIKKEEVKIEIKEPVVEKPVGAVEAPIVIKEDIRTETKEIPIAIGVASPVEIAEKPVVVKEEVKIEVKEPNVVNPTDVIEQPVNQAEEKTVILESYKTSQIKKWAESSTREGFGLVFIDEYDNGVKDTIRLIIPNSRPVIDVVKEEAKEDKKFLEIITDSPKKEEEKVAEVKLAVIEPPIEKKVQKNNCIEEALDTDFLKLRKKMAAAESDDDMISEAKRYFKTKCFSTQQLKNLGTLFLTDEGKYKFFDASYKYVSDLEVFNSLQAELKDEYYTSRFKAMLRN
jgi:hypothetical protein